MLPVRGWRLWYADGSTFSSADGTWAQAPADGVQFLILYHDPPYRTVITDDEGTYRLPGRKTAKHGTWMDDQAAFDAISRAARDAGPP